MFDANVANQPQRDSEPNAEWRDPYEGLRSSMALEEVARTRGVTSIRSADDLPKWPEDDLDVWEGFDEFLDELRHGVGSLRRWARDVESNGRREAMSIIQPVDRDGDTARNPKTEDDSSESGSTGGFWHSLTFEELARAQGVQPVRRLEDIMGGWPEDQRDDGFEDAIRAMRQEDLQREQAQ